MFFLLKDYKRLKKINKKIIKRKPYDFLNQLRKYKKFIKFKNNGAEAPHYIAQVRFNYKEIMSYTTPTSSVVLRTT